MGIFDDNQKPLKGINCSVTNCAYHNGISQCTASNISVGLSTATACCDTLCATFKPKDDEDISPRESTW